MITFENNIEVWFELVYVVSNPHRHNGLAYLDSVRNNCNIIITI